MQLISVNIGQERPIQNAKPSGKTGIYKQPVTEPVQVNRLGLPGDTIVDTENHGGVDQAVYVFFTPDYTWWSAELGRDLGPGTFGENLTISGIESAALSIGDRLRRGAAHIIWLSAYGNFYQDLWDCNDCMKRSFQLGNGKIKENNEIYSVYSFYDCFIDGDMRM